MFILLWVDQDAASPSNILEPSKNKIQKSLTTKGESTPTAKLTILQSISSAYENRRRSGWVSDVLLASSA